MNSKERFSLLAMACLALVAPTRAHASGGLHTVTMKEAADMATFVLVVEPAKAGQELVQIPVPYEKDGKKMVEKMGTTYLSFKVVKRLKLSAAAAGTSWTDRSYLHPNKELTVKLEELAHPGQTIRVVNSRTVTNNHVHARYLADGTRKIPIYRRLKDEVGPEELKKHKRLILFAGYNLRYEALVGSGGFGLVSIKKLKAVKKLLMPVKAK